MAILSRQLLERVGEAFEDAHDLPFRVVDLQGRLEGPDAFGGVAALRVQRNLALQQSINEGDPHVYDWAPGMVAWVGAVERDRRIVGGLAGGPVRLPGTDAASAVDWLTAQGADASAARRAVEGAPVAARADVAAAAAGLHALFYRESGFDAVLLRENSRRQRQQAQVSQAIEDQRGRGGGQALYAFEKERMLLACIRAGDGSGARRLLNDMLATIYLSSPKLVVLRARAVELLSYLTRAAIEDNPLMEPLIERNHAWTERLVEAPSFEALSQVLTDALDAFMDAVYLQGVNRSSRKVAEAVDYIGAHYMKPISLRHVASELQVNPSRLARLVKAHTGRTVVQLIHETRVAQARKLLQRSAMSCTEIAYEVGFGDQSYFIKHFRRLTGVTPHRYRRAAG